MKVVRKAVLLPQEVLYLYFCSLEGTDHGVFFFSPPFFEDPYKEDARQLLELAPSSSRLCTDPMGVEDHVPVYIPEPEHPEDLVPAEDEAPIETYITEVASAPTPSLPPPSFLPTLIRPPRTRAAMAKMRAAAPSTYHPLLPSGTPPLLPIPLPAPSTSRRADTPEADMPPRKRILLTAPRPRCEVGESSAAARQPGPTMASRVDYSFVDTVETRVRDTERRMMAVVEVGYLRVSHTGKSHMRESSEFYYGHHDARKIFASMRGDYILRGRGRAYEQESIETRQALARSEAYSRALEARINSIGTGRRSIPSEDPYEESARQLLEQAPHSPEYVPDSMELKNHVPVYIPEPEHPEDLVLAEDEAPIEAYITEVASAPTPPLPPPSFLPLLIRPPRTRAVMAQMRAATASTYHPLLPSGTPPLLPIPLPAPSTSRRSDIPKGDMLPRKRLLLTAPKPRCMVGESSVAAAARQPGPTMARKVDYSFVDTVETRVRDTKRRMMVAVEVVNLRVSHQADVHRRESSEFYSRHHDAQKDRAAVRAEIKILRKERLAYEKESIKTRQALARSEAYSRALEARIIVLDTQARHHDLRTMATVNQGMSVEEIEQIVAQRVANAIEAIVIYESINQTKQRENKVLGNASNKRKWEGDQNGSPNQQQNKENKVFRAHSVGPNYKKEYLGSLPLCNECKFHHIGLCASRYVGPSKVMEKAGDVAYKLELPEELSRVRNIFHVSNLKKCYADEPLAVPLDGLHLDDKLHFVEEPVEIMDREVKRLKRSRTSLVKVRWNSKRGPEFT
ncbi:hypothetical protein Tco_1563318 [Tanacetum coccineum]